MNTKETNSNWAVILCGGRGSRMGALTHEIPKSLVQVQGKPILWYVFWALYKHGFRNLIFPLGYKGKMIDEYIRFVSQDTGCRIFSKDTGEDTPIARRLSQISSLIPDNADFFLLNGDTIFDFDIEAMYRLHRDNASLVTLSSVEIVSNWGLILLKDGQLAGFERQRKVDSQVSTTTPEISGLVNSGMAWLNKAALNCVDLETCGDFETSLYSRVIEMNYASHYAIRGSWLPFDTPKDLEIRGNTAKTVQDLLAIEERKVQR